MSNNFRAGQKVVCVDDSGFNRDDGWIYPVRGRVYTVTGRALHWSDGLPGVLLAEIDNFALGSSQPFYYWRFRPAVDKPASIEVFRKMLVPSNEGVNA